MKKAISLVLVLSLLFSLGITASAATTEKASITYRAITLVLDGESFIPCDENGKTVEPFIMGGTTYLPLRALAQALGLGVSWDGATSTVSLSSGGTVKTGSGSYTPSTGTMNVDITYRDIKVVLDGKQLELVNAAGQTVEPFIMGGTTYLPLRTVGEALGLGINWDGTTSTVSMKAPTAEPPAEDGLWVVAEETVSYGSGIYETTKYEYDSFGNMILEAYEDSEGFKYEHKTKYDSKGECIGQEYADSTGAYNKIDSTDTLQRMEEYSPDGTNYIDESRYNANGDITYRLYEDKVSGNRDEYTYTYDANGVLVKLRCNSVYDGTDYSYTETYTYNGDVRTNSTVYDGEDFPYISYTSFSYDSEGRITKEEYSSEFYSTTNEYAYDKQGNITLEKWSDSDGNFWSYSYVYDAKGRVIKQEYQDDTMNTISEYKYDANDNMVRAYEYNSLTGYHTEYTWKYDSKGMLLSYRFEDTANYEETRLGYDANGLLLKVEVETAGETVVFTVTNDSNGLPVKAVAEYDGVTITYTASYTLIK